MAKKALKALVVSILALKPVPLLLVGLHIEGVQE
jgi:hypothetical protein